MRREKSGVASAAFAAELMSVRVFSSPLSRMRQSHGARCVRMLVVQLVVAALYQRGCA